MDEREKLERITGEPQPEKEERSLAYEMLQELKQTVKRLWWVIAALAAIIIVQFCVNTYERMQYDYVSSYEYTATGVNAIIDNEGNVIAKDISDDKLIEVLEIINNGNGDGEDKKIAD